MTSAPPIPLITALVCVALGAAVGAVVRYAVGLWLNPLLPHFPLGTLVVNVVGGLLIGAALVWLGQWGGSDPAHAALAQTLRLLLVTGFLGGFTTFSAFSAESLALLQSARVGLAILHSALHLGLSLAATALGAWLVQRWL